MEYYSPNHNIAPQGNFAGLSFSAGRPAAGMPARSVTDGTIVVLDDNAGLLESMNLVLECLYPDSVTELIQSIGQTSNAICSAVADVYGTRGISLLITDFHMINVTGAEVLAGLREQWGAVLPFRTMLYSAAADPVDIRDVGADAFLPKPFGLNELQFKISQLFPDAPSV